MAKLIDGVRVLALLGLGGFVMTSAGQAGCSSSTDGATSDGLGLDAGSIATLATAADCADGETRQSIDGQTVCCVGDACATAGAITPGSSCSTAGDAFAVDQRSFTLDTCVETACTGDTTSVPFASSATRDVGTLACQAGGANGALVWSWKGTPDVHQIKRECLAIGPIICSGEGQGQYIYGYGYVAPTYEYGYGGGGEYNTGSFLARIIVNTSETCTVPEATPNGCSEDNL